MRPMGNYILDWGRAPTDQEVAGHLGISVERYQAEACQDCFVQCAFPDMMLDENDSDTLVKKAAAE